MQHVWWAEVDRGRKASFDAIHSTTTAAVLLAEAARRTVSQDLQNALSGFTNSLVFISCGPAAAVPSVSRKSDTNPFQPACVVDREC